MKTGCRSIVLFLLLTILLGSPGCQPSTSPSSSTQQSSIQTSGTQPPASQVAESPRKGAPKRASSKGSVEPGETSIAAESPVTPEPVTHEVAPEAASKKRTETSAPQTHAVAKQVTPTDDAGVPAVLLSNEEAQQSRMDVGDVFPDFDLPLSSGGNATLVSRLGKRATVVLFWSNDRWMARAALSDLNQDVLPKFPREEVTLVGVAVGQPQEEVQTVLRHAGAHFGQFLDADATVLKNVSVWALPRIYVLDADGKIAWFDVDYSEATRRELQQTLEVLTKVGSK